MSKIVRLVLPGTVLVILVGAIAYGAPRKESFTSGRSESWFHRTFVTRRTKAHAQTQATSLPARDAQAVSLANQAVTALVGNTMITDATVQGTASYIAGSDQESGSATLFITVGPTLHGFSPVSRFSQLSMTLRFPFPISAMTRRQASRSNTSKYLASYQDKQAKQLR